jgi:hypothetical protein
MNKVRSEEPFGQRLIGIFTALSPDLHGKTMLRRLCLVKKTNQTAAKSNLKDLQALN